MARAATTSDVFNAIAEPQRRRSLTVLKDREQTVGAISEGLGLAQPATSKHLKVLKEVGLVDVDTRGRHRVYRLDARGLREVHEWTGSGARLSTVSSRMPRNCRERNGEMEQPETTYDREIVVERFIEAPRRFVFEAFTTDEHLSRWWGPDGFTTTTRTEPTTPSGSGGRRSGRRNG